MARLKHKALVVFFLLVVPSLSEAQVPALNPIPDGLSAKEHEELAQRRSSLENQWTSLRSKVDTHNQRCANVPANTAIANECRQAMVGLQAEIAAYVEAVTDFNRRVEQASAPLQEMAVSSILTEAQEIELGRRMSGDLEARMTFVTDPRVAAYTQGLVDRLARHSTRPGIVYRVRVCNDCAIPACFFACSFPGGHIYINGALIRSLSNEAELAAVLAHEVAHVAARHQAQNLDDHARATGLGVLLGGPVWPLVQSAVFMKFKRDQEREADRLAVEILYQVRIKPTGLITFFEKLRRTRPTPGILEAMHDVYFSSHPSEQERIQNLSPLLADPRFNEIRAIDSAEFHTVKTRVASL